MHFIDGTEWGQQGILDVVNRALALSRGASPKRFESQRIGMLFLNPSLRTRTSMEAAAAALGAYPIVLQPGRDSWALETQMGAVMDGDKPEHIKDAIGVLSGYVDALAVRSFAGMTSWEEDSKDPVLTQVCKHASVPVANLESALWHPMQGMADATTWINHLGEDLRGQPLALTWAPHPKALPMAVPNQVLLTAATLGMDVRVTHPEGFSLSESVIERCGEVAVAAGGAVTVHGDQQEALRGARVVVAKSWGGVEGYTNRETEAQRRAAAFGWQVKQRQMGWTDRAGFMHCLPVRRNVVVSDEVLDGPSSWVMEEANFRLWTAMAVLERMMGGT